MKKEMLLRAAVAGMALGAVVAQSAVGGEKKDEVKCWGVNGCGAHASCSVGAEELAAIKALLGEKDYRSRFGKSESHACGAHAQCGASAGILNWTKLPADECRAQGGFVIEAKGGRKLARKA
jgi:hypothetical protein